MTDLFRCSFCGVVQLCAEQLGAEIVVERRDSAGPVKQAAETRELEDARRRVSKLESAIKAIAREVTQLIPGPLSIRCMWCDILLDSKDMAREHVATCERHPAVVELRKLQERDT